MAVWVGGLAALVLVLPAATRELEPPDAQPPDRRDLARFSPIALACVAAILLTGLGQAYAYVRHLDNLLDTAYGRAVLIKFVLLVGVLIPLGAYNRYRSVPRLRRIAAGGEAPGRAGLTPAPRAARRGRADRRRARRHRRAGRLRAARRRCRRGRSRAAPRSARPSWS